MRLQLGEQVVEPADAVTYGCDDLGVRMTEHRAHLARGEAQHAPAGGIVEKRTLGPNRHEIDKLAAILEQVTSTTRPKLRIARHVPRFLYHSSSSWSKPTSV